MATIAQIVSWWIAPKVPSTAQRAETFNSFRHKEEPVPLTDVDGLANALNGKVATADLNNEATVRAAADTTLQTNITAEATARASAITGEATTRAAADTTLQTNITAEATTRAAADATLQTNITAEATARAAADTTLQTQMNALSIGIIRKDPVATFSALATTYPTPANGWTAFVIDVNLVYQYNGTTWANTGWVAYPSDVATKTDVNNVSKYLPESFTQVAIQSNSIINDLSSFSPNTVYGINATFINVDDANKSLISGTVSSISTVVKNAESGRKATWFIFRKTNSTTIQCVYASAEFGVPLDGLNTLTGLNVPINAGDYIGVSISTSTNISANSINIYQSGGNTVGLGLSLSGVSVLNSIYSTSGAVTTRLMPISAVVKPIPKLVAQGYGNIPNGYLQLDNLGNIPSNLTPTPVQVTNSLSKTPSTIIATEKLNGDSYQGVSHFPVNSLFFDGNSPSKYAGVVTSFWGWTYGSETGRTANFVIVQPNGSSYKVIYVSPSVLCETAGKLTYTPPTPVNIPSGSFIACRIIASSQYLGFYDSGGPQLFNGFSSGSSSYVVGNNYTFASQPASRYFPIGGEVVYTGNIFFQSSLYANTPLGYAGLDSSNQFPNTVTRKADNWWFGKKVIWVGTSIPAGNNAVSGASTGYSYPQLVGQMLNCNVVNEAVGSSGIIWDGSRALSLSATISELTASFGSGYAPQSYQNKLIGKSADFVIFDHGFNDRGALTSNLGTIDSLDRSTFYGAFNYVIDKMYIDNPNVRFAFMSSPTRFYSAANNFNVGMIDSMSTALNNLALKYNAPFFDMAKLCQINDRTFSLYTADGLHPKPETRPALAQLLYNWLKVIG